MSDWITDRRPTDDAIVYGPDGKPAQYRSFSFGTIQPWKPIPHIEPYVKPKRYWVEQRGLSYVVINVSGIVASCIPTRETAERIAAIYEEVMP